MYLVFPVIVLSAMFILLLWTELEGKHCQYHYDFDYDYDKKNKIQSQPFNIVSWFIAVFL